MPLLDFIMQGASIGKVYLTKADKIIKCLAKRWLSKSFWKNQRRVGFPLIPGLLLLADLYYFLAVANAYQILHANDTAVRNLAINLLRTPIWLGTSLELKICLDRDPIHRSGPRYALQPTNFTWHQIPSALALTLGHREFCPTNVTLSPAPCAGNWSSTMQTPSLPNHIQGSLSRLYGEILSPATSFGMAEIPAFATGVLSTVPY